MIIIMYNTYNGQTHFKENAIIRILFDRKEKNDLNNYTIILVNIIQPMNMIMIYIMIDGHALKKKQNRSIIKMSYLYINNFLNQRTKRFFTET